MIDFKELTISRDGKRLVIDVAVKSQDYYQNVYLDTIKIQTLDLYKTKLYCHSVTIPGDLKVYRLVLSTNDRDLSLAKMPNIKENLFLVTVTTKGNLTASTEIIPCGEDERETIGVAFYERAIMKELLQYIKELDKECSIPKNFIDLLLRLKAMKVAMLTRHWDEVVEFYKNFILDSDDSNSCNSHYRCNCYG